MITFLLWYYLITLAHCLFRWENDCKSGNIDQAADDFGVSSEFAKQATLVFAVLFCWGLSWWFIYNDIALLPLKFQVWRGRRKRDKSVKKFAKAIIKIMTDDAKKRKEEESELLSTEESKKLFNKVNEDLEQ